MGLATVRRLVVLLAVVLVAMVPAAVGLAADAGTGIGVVNTESGFWYLQDPASGETTSFYYGDPGDEPFMGDWDCDGVDTPGLYRKSDGYVYLRNSNTQGNANVSFYFGNPGDHPLPGDFDGDGCDTVSIYRPREATFYIINRLGSGDAGLGRAEVAFMYGDPGDQPLAGDFDGDGVDTVGVFRRSTGQVHYKTSPQPSSRSVTVDFGSGASTVLAGSWTGGADRLAAHVAGAGTFYLAGDDGADASERAYGNSSHQPIAGRFGALPGGDPDPPDIPPYPDVGHGKRIIYSNSGQRVWLINADGSLARTYLVSGRRHVPVAGGYRVYSRSLHARAAYGGITMTHMVRFAHGVRLPYGFHSIPVWPDGTPLQTEEQLGTYQSGGCVRQAYDDAVFLWDFAPIGTPVHVLP